MVSAWRNFKNIFSRPLFTIIFRAEMLKFHPYSILTGETMVGFVIYCVKPETNKDDFRLYFKLLGKSCRGRHHSEISKTITKTMISSLWMCPQGCQGCQNI
jgi:hypothetical protein